MNQSHIYGRFTITIENLKELNEYIDLVVESLLSSGYKNTVNDYQHLIDIIKQHDLELIRLSPTLTPYLTLFNDVNQLKSKLVSAYVFKNINNDTQWICLLPLSIQFSYMKYSTTLLTLKPSDNCFITLDDLKTFLNQLL